MRQSSMFAFAQKFGVATALAATMSVASAAPAFTIDPSVFGPAAFPPFGAAPFQADAMSTAGQTRVQLSSAFGSAAGTATGTGYLQFTALQLNGSPVSVITSGMGLNWQFWAEFSFTMTLVGGAPNPGCASNIIGGLGCTNSNYVLNSVSLDMYGERMQDGDSVFNAGNTGVNPSVTHGVGTVHIGHGDLLMGAAGINLAGGSSFNPTMLFDLIAPNGPNFFVAPDPFYPLAFASQTNDAAQIVRNGATNEMHLATGGTAAFSAVPEPQSLALVGLALVGAGLAGRRQLRK